MSKGLVLLVCETRGQYVPQEFARRYRPAVIPWDGITAEEFTILSDANHEHYWETWDDVLKNASSPAAAGGVYRLYQNGDLWAYCEQHMTAEERKFLGFEEITHDPA